ncbi:hypothetical protein CR513_17734, partial [Mucuna pruriens]
MLGMGVNNHPICYFSEKFCPKLIFASTYVRKLHTIIVFVKKWRTYLLGRKLIAHTDQHSLKELMTQLLGYSHDIVYKSKPSNKVADSLSRVLDNLDIQNQQGDHPKFQISQGLVFYKGKLYLDAHSS